MFAVLLWVLSVGVALAMETTSEDAIEGTIEKKAPSSEIPEASELGSALLGVEIYERYTEVRATETFQKVRIISKDPGGSAQLSSFELRVQDARDENGKPTRKVRFRTRSISRSS